ncbi:hypothetical protein LTR56_026031 [Elasticomyces elasticus]|nr:hypothetical protein LTR22_028156 [Elasticomyces elasticus]KAK3616322.1 hypothetical protein LTR56_026031 [Elasticomyces elasticus]KAK4906253.1 hypothetical protein LTR49_024565 [Elasticomyces elasticus]KAK5739729.1 hypothetical protein LTS12_025180 [Elasticomyces elasticus]
MTNIDARYMDSKLLEVLYAQKLAAAMSKCGKSNVCLNVVNPGYCVLALKPPTSLVDKFSERIFARSTDDSGRILVDAIAPERAEQRHGKYIDDGNVKKAATWMDTKDGKRTAQRVWMELNVILEDIGPGSTSLS